MMRLRKPLAILIATLTPLVALAKEGAEHAAVCEPNEFCFQVQGFYILDFIAFVAILVYAARKPLAAFLDQRYADVSKEISAARELRAAAEQKYQEHQSRLANLDVEMQQILSDARAGTALEMERIVADAEALVERTTAEERTRLSQESKRLHNELRRETAALALQLAEQIVRAQLAPETQQNKAQQRLLERTLAEIEALPANAQLQAANPVE